MTGEVVDAARAERMGWSPRWCPTSGCIDRALELAGADRRGSRPDHAGAQGDLHDGRRRECVDPALAAEEKIAFAQHRDFEGLGDQFRAVSERNKRQIES